MAVLDRWNAATAAGSANWVAAGDSIGAEGWGATTRDNRWISRALAIVRSTWQPGGIVGGVGYVPAWYSVGGDSAGWAAPYSSRSGAMADETWAANLSSHQTTLNPGGTATYPVTGTAVDLWYLDGDGSWTYSVDSGAATTVAMTGSYTNKKIRVSLGAAGGHSFTVTSVTGYVAFAGHTAFNGDETTGIRLFDAGHSGWKSSDFNSVVGYFAACVAMCSPDLVTIGLGTNDLGTLTAAQTKSNVQALIAAIRSAVTAAGGTQPSMLVALTYQPGSNGNWAATDTALRSIATDDTTVGLLDFATPMGPSSAGGYWSSDALHPSNLGHAYMARIAATTIGVPPVTITASGAGAASGSATIRSTLKLSASGTSSASGSAAATIAPRSYARTASGSSAASGSAAAAIPPRTYSVAASGSSAGSGTAAVAVPARTYPLAATGTAVGSGSAAVNVPPRTYSLSASGSAAASGAAAITLASSTTMAATGTAAATGAATLTQVIPAAASGAASGSGSATTRQSLAATASGGAAASGSATTSQKLTVAASGSSPSTGSAAFTGIGVTATGTAAAAGTAVLALKLRITASGASQATGAAAQAVTAAFSASGASGAAGGAALDVAPRIYPLTAAGAAQAAGAAALAHLHALAAAGTAAGSGSAVVIHLGPGRDITLAGSLPERRWAASLPRRRWTGGLP